MIMNPPTIYVKSSLATVHHVLSKYEMRGEYFKLDQPWNSIGRKPLLNEAEFTQCDATLNSKMGEKTLKDVVNDYWLII